MNASELVGELENMTEVFFDLNQGKKKKPFPALNIQFEFLEEENMIPYFLEIEGQQSSLLPQQSPDDNADIIIQTQPEILWKVINGEHSSREAFMSGKIRLRKAPSMKTLIHMRSLFNQYRKYKLRQHQAG